MVTKVFTFDAAHQLINHKGKCANLHGHTYKLEVNLYSDLNQIRGASEEGFVIDFSDLKAIVKSEIIEKLDHSFISMGNESVLKELHKSGSKVTLVGFRTSCENLAAYICFTLKKSFKEKLYSIKLWETPTGSAEVFAKDIPSSGPDYRLFGGCDLD